MRAVFAVLMAVWMIAGQATAENRPLVVVELFTSQGCSSCPPADGLLAELAVGQADLLPLALHVDYWDYIGWADSFARPEHTLRQKAYAHAAGRRSIYTPEMVVGGVDHVIGVKPMMLADLLARHRATLGKVLLQGDIIDGQLRLTAESAGLALPPLMVAQLVQFTARETVQITRGENAGQSVSYANIVTDMRVIGQWDGVGRLNISADVPGTGPVAVVLQASGPGEILAAIRLR